VFVCCINVCLIDWLICFSFFVLISSLIRINWKKERWMALFIVKENSPNRVFIIERYIEDFYHYRSGINLVRIYFMMMKVKFRIIKFILTLCLSKWCIYIDYDLKISFFSKETLRILLEIINKLKVKSNSKFFVKKKNLQKFCI